VRSNFEFDGPQRVTLKGKGELAVYRLLGRQGQVPAAAAVPASDKR